MEEFNEDFCEDLSTIDGNCLSNLRFDETGCFGDEESASKRVRIREEPSLGDFNETPWPEGFLFDLELLGRNLSSFRRGDGLGPFILELWSFIRSGLLGEESGLELEVD
jgi:hypothetical protein